MNALNGYFNGPAVTCAGGLFNTQVLLWFCRLLLWKCREGIVNPGRGSRSKAGFGEIWSEMRDKEELWEIWGRPLIYVVWYFILLLGDNATGRLFDVWWWRGDFCLFNPLPIFWGPQKCWRRWPQMEVKQLVWLSEVRWGWQVEAAFTSCIKRPFCLFHFEVATSLRRHQPH